MNSISKLTAIKIIHTLIWLFFNVALGYMAYAATVNKIDKYVWIGLACIVVEWIVLLVFKWQCPFTILARKYSLSTNANFDIYLPNWLAKYNKEIYITLFVAIISGLIFRLLNNRL